MTYRAFALFDYQVNLPGLTTDMPDPTDAAFIGFLRCSLTARDIALPNHCTLGGASLLYAVRPQLSLAKQAGALQHILPRHSIQCRHSNFRGLSHHTKPVPSTNVMHYAVELQRHLLVNPV